MSTLYYKATFIYLGENQLRNQGVEPISADVPLTLERVRNFVSFNINVSVSKILSVEWSLVSKEEYIALGGSGVSN